METTVQFPVLLTFDQAGDALVEALRQQLGIKQPVVHTYEEVLTGLDAEQLERLEWQELHGVRI